MFFSLTSSLSPPSSSSNFVSCPRGSPDLGRAAQPTPKILHMIPFCFMHPKWSALHWQGLQQIIAGENRRLGFGNQMKLLLLLAVRPGCVSMGSIFYRQAPLIHSFNRHVLNIYWVPGTVPGWGTGMGKSDVIMDLMEPTLWSERKDNVLDGMWRVDGVEVGGGGDLPGI